MIEKYSSLISGIFYDSQSSYFSQAIDVLQKFVEDCAKLLNVTPPKVTIKFFPHNKYINRGRGLIRGEFDGQNIYLAGNYDFKDYEDILRAGRHEISEWLEWLLFRNKELINRFSTPHSTGEFSKIRSLVQKFFPHNPQSLIKTLKSRTEL